MLDPRVKLVERNFEKVERIVAFASGKGGVGKSLISSATSYILSLKGYRVAYLDLDFYGYAGPLLFSIDGQIKACKEGIELPISAGVKVMSTGYFLADNPFPLMGKDKIDYLLDLFSAVKFGEIDLMVIDLPPGLGDELTYTQRIFRDKINIVPVTLSSEMSLNVVEKLVKYLKTEEISIIGVIVNMFNIFREYEIDEIRARLELKILSTLSYHPEVENFRTIKEKLENAPRFKKEIEETVENLLKELRLD
ncbi:MAG: P-loop NTPase [Candidatus Caldarchaeales archaeon]